MTRLLVANGDYCIIDVDAVGHEAVEQKATQIIACFGNKVVNEDGGINRKRLGGIVFRDQHALRQLEEIVHPWMKRRIAARLKELQPRAVVIDAALLCYLELDQLCDAVIWVKASLLRRLLRVQRRDHASLSDALRIMRVQKKLKLTTRTADTYTMRNNTSQKRFIRKCTQQLEALWT